jgi:hypothetical protein
MTTDLDTLKESETALRKNEGDLLAEWNKRLVIEDGKIVSGLLWIPGPFKTDFWSGRRKKPKATTCCCPTCGKKHAKKPA